MILYGAERVIVEGLRTDSLYIGHTSIRISQLLSGILIVAGIALFLDVRRRWKNAQYEGTDTISDPSGGLEAVVAKMENESGNSAAESGEPESSADQTNDTDDEKQ